ncbi:MAG TPA: RNA ligase partner protein [Thermodesulfobacteriota bacterium]|jgi:RNA ligase partner protein|nr:RNA ligase partner protein [Thermodesulfobacteriota bacterium]
MTKEKPLDNKSSDRLPERGVEENAVKFKAEEGVSAPPALLRTRLVLDTSLFVNPDAQRQLGKNLEDAVQKLLRTARVKNIELYMPISIFRELSHFAPPEALISFRQEAIVRAPDLYNLQVPAAVFQAFIRELRERINKGLRIAEEAVYREPTADNLRRLRQQYREVLRAGIVDSVEDLDVVLLAKEIGGAILSADEGIAKMAEALGIEVISANYFIQIYAVEES